MNGTWLLIVSSAAAFSAVHWGAFRWVERDFGRAFMLSRGIAAVVLVTIGLVALVDSAEQWRSVFVYHGGPRDWMRAGLLVVGGHLVADCLWMAVGKLWLGADQRGDLLVHHALGLAAVAIALHLQAGQALVLIAMLSEVLPVASGLKALGGRLGSSAIHDFADRAHFAILVWVRLPFWGTLLVLTVGVIAEGRAGELLPAYLVVATVFVALVGLDLYWTRECLAKDDRRQPSSTDLDSDRARAG